MTDAPPSRADQLAYVQGLRGVAAAAVVLYHARVFIDGGRYLDLGTRLFGAGSAGVDLFFVISGLIMVHTTRQVAGGPRDAAAFAVRRFARIWPVYVVGFVAMRLLTSPLTNPAFATTWTGAVSQLAFRPQNPHDAAPFFGYPLLHVGWTLVYEVFFYALFAIALVARRGRALVLVALFATCLLAVPLFFEGRVTFDALESYGFGDYRCIATSPILWDFLFGAAIGWLRGTRFTPRDRGLLACAVALAAGLVVWQLLSGVRAGHGPTRWGLPMALLVLALTLYDKAHPIRMPRWLTWLGDISFSLYLFHILPQMVPRLFPDHPEVMSGGGFFVASIVVGVVLGYLGYRFLERGLSEWFKRRLLGWLGLARR